MAGIDLTGVDPWGAVAPGGSGSKAMDIIGGVSGVAGLAGLSSPAGWVSMGIQLLSGGKTTISGAAGGSQTALNTSGYVVGEGDAEGGNLSTTLNNPAKWPWWGWAAGALVAIAIIKKANK